MRRPRRYRSAAIALAAILSGVLPSTAAPRIAQGTGRFLIRVKAGARPAGVRHIRTLTDGRWQLVSFDGTAVALARLPGVAQAEPDYAVHVAAVANDPCVTGPCEGTAQWNLYATSATLAWDGFPGRFLTAGAKVATDQVKVAVVDTTIDGLHPDFANAGGDSTDASGGGQIDGEDAHSWIPANKRAGSQAYHGTFVAGIIGAAANNAADVAGVGYAAQIMPLAAIAGDGTSDAATLADAIRFAWDHGARVINLSLGLTADSAAVHQAIIDVTTGAHPALVVAAAGNNTADTPYYPGSYPEVMSVSGFDPNGRFAQCSNYNGNVSVSAPGAGVLSLSPMPARRAVISCGTSAAAAHVSGVAALLFGQDPARTPATVRAIIEKTADDDGPPGRDSKFGWGKINADRALHDGLGPRVSQLSASTPSRTDAVSTIDAWASGSAPITAAEVYLDRPGDPSTCVALKPFDGSWGSLNERLTGSLAVPESLASGAHPIFVRSFAGQWGAATRGLLYVDRSPPVISNVRTEQVIRPLQSRSTISFTLTDDHSSRFDWSINIGGLNGYTWQDARKSVGSGAHSDPWIVPVAALPGRYDVSIWAIDDAGNVAAAITTILVI